MSGDRDLQNDRNPGESVRKGLYVDEKLVVLFYPGWTDALSVHHPAIAVEHYYYYYYFIYFTH